MLGSFPAMRTIPAQAGAPSSTSRAVEAWVPAFAGMVRMAGKEPNMIYELRVYHCVPGRLPDLIKRFDTITLKLWEKHGIRQAGFWTVVVGDSNQDLYYLLQWESLAEREKKWGGFMTDP